MTWQGVGHISDHLGSLITCMEVWSVMIRTLLNVDEELQCPDPVRPSTFYMLLSNTHVISNK